MDLLLEHINTRTNNLYVEGFDDYVITEICYVLSNDQCRLFVHNFAFFSFSKTKYSNYLNKFKLHHIYMYLYLCV